MIVCSSSSLYNSASLWCLNLSVLSDCLFVILAVQSWLTLVSSVHCPLLTAEDVNWRRLSLSLTPFCMFTVHELYRLSSSLVSFDGWSVLTARFHWCLFTADQCSLPVLTGVSSRLISAHCPFWLVSFDGWSVLTDRSAVSFLGATFCTCTDPFLMQDYITGENIVKQSVTDDYVVQWWRQKVTDDDYVVQWWRQKVTDDDYVVQWWRQKMINALF